jgi:hypothetical protein
MTRGPDPAYAYLAAVAVVWIAAAAAVHPPAPPDAPGEDAFDVRRALHHVERIAAEPHPAGSPANDAVRAYLEEELRALGLEPVVRTARIPYGRELPWLADERDEQGRAVLPIANVLARIPGTAGEGAVLLQAHYDSRPDAPGAGDDAAGVAAVLEALRLLLPGAPFRNDLIVHLDDGEELGLFGARWFVENDPWMADVRCVLNFDARGNAGAPICFQVGPESASLVRALAASHPEPVGASLAAAVYERMPNDTSFTPFLRRGLPGLNFAFVGGASAYHRPWDAPQNLSRRTLQRLGEVTHAVTRQVLGMNLGMQRAPGSAGAGTQAAGRPERGGDAVFFNALDGRLLVYPLGWTYALLVPPLVLLALAVLRGRRGGARLGAGLGAAVVLAVVAYGAGLGAWWVARGVAALGAAVGVFDGPPRGNLLSATLGGFGALGAGVATALGLLGRLRGRDLADQQRDARGRLADGVALGGALAWAALLLLLTCALPAAAYVAGWPLLLALVPLPFALGAAPRRAAALGLLASFALAATLLAPTFYLLVQVRSIHPSEGAKVAAALAGLGALLYAPLLARCVPRAGHGPALVLGVASAAALLAGAIADASGI